MTPSSVKSAKPPTALFRRADWQWALYGVPCDANGWPTQTVEDVTIIHGGTPENGFISYRYQGYDESLLMHVLASGLVHLRAAAGVLPCVAEDVRLAKQYGIEYLSLGSAVHSPAQSLLARFTRNCRWVHASKGSTISRIAAVPCACSGATRRRIRKNFRGYGPLIWGVSASDGPGPATKTDDNVDRVFWMYEARGVPDGPDDGTLAPGAVAASIPFAAELVIDTLRELVRAHPHLRSEYGLRASLNPTFGDWISPLNYGLDQGPIVMMIENHRTGLPWNLMRRCPYIWRGLRKAGFAGGWIESEREPQCPRGRRGAVARAGHAILQVVREHDASRTIASASDGNHAGRANPLLRRSDRCQNHAGSPA
jgi:hypothetical protein